MQRDLRIIMDEYVFGFSAEKNLSKRTIYNKKNLFNRLYSWLGGREFNLDNTRAYIAHLVKEDWASNSIRTEILNLRAFANFMENRGYLKKNFANQLIKPKIIRKEFVYVKPEIVEQIIIAGTEPSSGDNMLNKQRKEETRLALRFTLRTGLRINELIKLKGSDINLKDDPPSFRVSPSKGHGAELLPFPRDMIKEIEPRVNNDRLFRITRETCNLSLKRGAIKLGVKVKITNHFLRHIFASNLVKNKVPLQYVSRLLRHSSVDITDKTYSHLDLTDLSLMMNAGQSSTRGALSFVEKVEYLEETLRSLGFDKDPSLDFEIKKENDLFFFAMKQRK